MNLTLIGAGLFFFLNPILGIRDVLPDFIGCLLIMYGIRDGGYMIEKLSSSAKMFRFGAAISIIRFGSYLLGAESQHTLPLTLAFMFAVAELIVYIPAVTALFAGFDYAAMRHGGSGVLSMGKRMGIYTDESGQRQYGEIQDDTTGRLAVWFCVFFVVRGVLSVVPELPALQLSESQNVGDVTGFQFASIGTLIRVAVALLVIVFSVITLVKYVKFLRAVKHSGDFLTGLDAELQSRFGDLSEVHLCSFMKLMSLFSAIAVLLYMGFYDYQMNVLPRYVPAAMVCICAVMMTVTAKEKRAVKLLPALIAVAAMPLSVVTCRLQKEHYLYYKHQMMSMFESGVEFIPDRHINEPTAEYMKMAMWESAEAFVLCGAVILLLAFYLKIALGHTARLASVPERDRDPLRRSLMLRGGLMIGAAALSGLCYTAYRFVLPYFDSAQVVCIGVNILSFAMYLSFALQANKYVYGNNYEI